MNFVRKLCAVLTAAILSASAVPVSAVQLSEESIMAGYIFAEAVELIRSRYMNSADISAEELVRTALFAISDELDEHSGYFTAREMDLIVALIEGLHTEEEIVKLERLETFPEIADMDLSGFRYVAVTTMGSETAALLAEHMEQMRRERVRGIILDLRGNSGGHIEATLDAAAMLVPRGTITSIVNSAGLRRTFTSRLEEAAFEHIVVLVDRDTASGAEILAAALQDSGAATIVGETTYGKGLVQNIFPMLTGGALSLTTDENFRRNGGTIQGVGVVPCIVVERSSGGVDEVLVRGAEVLARYDK